MRKKRTRVIIVIMIVALEIASMAAMFIFTSNSVSSMLKDKAVKNMNIIARDRAQLVETYITGCTQYLDGYSTAREIREVLEDPENPEKIKIAREYTADYCKNIENLEGLYVAQWDTYVLAHTNPNSVDQTFRDEAGAAQLEYDIKEAGAPFCSGIVQAPVTGKMVIPVYAPVRNDQGEYIGFVGAAFYTNRLVALLHDLSSGEPTEVNYALVDFSNKRYIFAPTLSDTGAECTDPDILDAEAQVRINYTKDYTYSFSNNEIVASCYYMSDRNWLFIVMDSNENVFSTISQVRSTMILTIAVTAALTVVISIALLRLLIAPAEEGLDEIEII